MGTYSSSSICVGMLHACTSDTVENIAGAAAGRRTKVKSVMGCTGNKTFLSFLQQVSALLARPAGQQFCSHGSGALIQLLEMPCFALPFEEVLKKKY